MVLGWALVLTSSDSLVDSKESVVDSKDKDSSFYNYNKNDSCKTYILFEYVVYKSYSCHNHGIIVNEYIIL